MKTIQFQPGVAISSDQSALDQIIETPSGIGFDLLVQVEAIGLNPVDTKVRPDADEEASTLGYDAAGIVAEVGDKVTNHKVGDKVYYAGDITRSGTNSEFHLVDSRIVGKRPNSLDASASAALPLTSITAWEALFDRLSIDPDGANKGDSILIIGGAGGVGSIGIQLAKLAGLTVITTASRPESEQWVKQLGADFVVNHKKPLAPQLESINFKEVDYIANFNNTEAYWDIMGELIAPQGKIVLIVEPSAPLDINANLKMKSVSIHWEFMFTRSMFTTKDIDKQSILLNQIALLVDSGKLKTTSNDQRSPINAANLIQAHRDIESGNTIGKITISNWN